MQVDEEDFVVILAELAGDELVEASIAVGSEGTFARKISTGDTHLASTAPDVRSFKQILRDRLAELGVRGPDSDSLAGSAGDYAIRLRTHPGERAGSGTTAGPPFAA